jgi:hypothetical protein
MLISKTWRIIQYAKTSEEGLQLITIVEIR